jgi:replicative DNA helicase
MTVASPAARPPQEGRAGGGVCQGVTVASTDVRVAGSVSENFRVPPQALEAERAVLGAMLLESRAVAKAIEILDETAFYRPAHRQIFRALISLWDRKEDAIDAVAVADELHRQGSFDAVGGAAALAALLNSVATAANVEYHAQIVKEKAILRRLIEVSTEIAGQAYQGEDSPADLLDRAERAMFSIADTRIRKGFVRVRELVNPTMKRIDELYKEKKSITGVGSGFADLDHLTSGFQNGDLIVLAGRPSMGKTSLVLNVAANVALRSGLGVGIFSLEMSMEQLLLRILCSEARIGAQRVRTGYVRDKEWPLLITAAGQLMEAPIYIDDTPAMSVLEMRAKARRLKSETNLGLIVVDYLQLMSGASRSESRQQEISEISRGLKALAKELKVPVVALSQLSRAVEARSDHRPMLSDLRESGAIEQDADVVCFIYREEHYKRTDDNEGMGEIIVGKQRNGPVGVARVAFIAEYTRFENLAREAEPPV